MKNIFHITIILNCDEGCDECLSLSNKCHKQQGQLHGQTQE